MFNGFGNYMLVILWLSDDHGNQITLHCFTHALKFDGLKAAPNSRVMLIMLLYWWIVSLPYIVKYSFAFVLMSLWTLKRIANEEAKVPHQPVDHRSPCRSQSYRRDREWRSQTAAVRTLFPMRSSQQLVYQCMRKNIFTQGRIPRGTVPPKIFGGGTPMHWSPPKFREVVLSDACESINRVKKRCFSCEERVKYDI